MSNVLGSMMSLGGGIVLSIDSSILIVHWFEGGKWLIGFERCLVWTRVLCQNVM